MTVASLIMVSRGVSSRRPRLPTTTPPAGRCTPRSCSRFTSASISTTTETPRPPVMPDSSSRYPGAEWSRTWPAPARRIPPSPPRTRRCRRPRRQRRRPAGWPGPRRPLAPWTSTVSPGWRRAFWNSARQAVTAPHGRAPGAGQRGGQRMDHRRVHHGQVRVRARGPGRSQRRHEHPVPGVTSSTPAPTASTTPDPSNRACRAARGEERVGTGPNVGVGGVDADRVEGAPGP